MSVTFSKSKGLYKDGIFIQCFFKHDVFTSALSACRHDNGFISLDFHDDNGIHFIEVTDKDVDFLMSCDDSQTAFDYALSLIPPSENTGNKTVATGEQVGVVDSVGDALSFVLPVQNKALKNVSFVRLDHDVIATWNAFACVAFYKFPIEYFKCLENLKTWHKFIRFIEDKATDVSQAETIKHFVRSVLYPQNSLSCQDFDNINDALLCAMRQIPHRFNEFQAIQSKILSVFPFLPEYSDTVLDDDIPPFFAESGIFDKAE